MNVFWYGTERITCSCAFWVNRLIDQHNPAHYFLGGEPRPKDGAVIVFHGGNNPPEAVDTLNRWAEDQPWAVFISVGDEWGTFPYYELDGSKVWVQTPKPGVTSSVDRYFIEGYPHDCEKHLKEIGELDRCYDWSFAGQINHQRRDELSYVLADCNGPHFLLETKAFGSGLSHDLYYTILRQSKVVPCPSGLATPDSFRFAEALEAGAVPVLDAYAPDRVKGYWEMVLGEHPFFVIEDWEQFPEIVNVVNKKFEEFQKITQEWWGKYKRDFSRWLEQDLISLGAK